MKIELKNVKLNLTFSEETYMFNADVYVDGVKTAYANNDGRGGSIGYNSYDGKRDLLVKAENYLKTLPATKYKDFEIKSNMENYIDDLISKIAEEKENAKNDKKLLKNMSKGICYGTKDAYNICTWGKHTIEDMLKSPQGRKVISDKIKVINSKGGVVLNTNLGSL